MWHGSITIDPVKDLSTIRYKYILREEGKEETVEFGDDRIVELDSTTTDEIVFFDTWNYSGDTENVYFTQPFSGCVVKNTCGYFKNYS
ncbi:MAG: hypothetical protein WDM90_22240 [Ferruginibacter sp.]